MSAAAGAGGASDGAVRSFSGENEDGREYKRWKVWVTNKLLTLDTKVPAKARGAYVYTLLSGKALECVEHLDPSDYQVENGEDKLFALLDERFPQKEASDEMSEALTEVFNLKALEGETLKVWISRATEMFDRCKRKCQVSFPEEAKGWLILHRSGLNDEQKAVIMARSGGVMKRETIGKAMRSCYPEYVVSKRKTMGVAVVDPDEPPPEDFEQDPVFQEVESFLAEHELAVPAEEPDEIYEEHEVAEALAVTWKEKRKELTKMQKNRRFSASSDLKKAYRVEIEELKKRTRCHKCQQVGHWSRECKSASKGKGRSGAPTAKSSDSGAAMVEASTDHFVAAVTMEEMPLSTLDILRQRQQQNVKAPVIPEVLLVSSPGYGVIDSGCGRTIVGCNTLEDFKQLWIARGIAVPEPFHEVNHFKFGNGQRETSEISMRLPVYIAGRRGTIKAAVVKGNAPLLISRGALQTLRAIVDFGENQMKIFEDQAVVPLHTNAAGQYVISVMDDVKVDSGETFQEVMLGQSDRSWTEVRPSAVLPSEPLISTSATESIDQIPPPAEESNEPGLPRMSEGGTSERVTDGKEPGRRRAPSWKANQQVKALNLVDQASCYQLMIPFHERETSAVLKKLIAEHWVRIFGPPKEVVIDQARTNLGDHLQSYLDSLGCHVHQIAGEAHWQLGRTESHGGWFARVLAKTLAEFPPAGREDWESCVVHSHVKNTMIQSYGYTPHQHVFGKNPEIPSDLMNEPLHVVPATASLTDEAIAKSQAIRTAARKSVIETQDDLALRRAFSARPRMVQQFQPGDLVAYWRCQKYQQGQVIQGGNWYGTAVVIGNVGKNYVIAHRKQIFRAAPEQLRAATNEEKAMVTTPNTELLGIRDMIEGGTFRSHQFIDLVPGHYPTMEEPPPVVNNQSEPQVSSDPAGALNVPESPAPIAPDVPVPVDKSPESEVSPGDESQLKESSSPHHESSNAQSASSTYGPLRRVRSKNGPPSLYRPPAMQADDFAEMMKEIVPQLVEEATKDTDASMHAKRPLESTDAVEEPSSHRQNTEQYSEVMSVEDVNHLSELFADPSTPIEVLIANYMQKKTSKEVPPMNNPPEMQSLVDESKQTEWSTILEKGAVRVHYGRRAAEIRSKYSDRFIGSRFVIVKKAVEENKSVDDSDPSSFRVKSRWCLQGHLDPDLNKKVEAGLLQSPTLSQMGRMLTMQLIASNGWMLQLGDIKGAFLEAGPLPSQFRPLYAHQPRGGIPGVPPDAVLEVVGNLYGQNDAPLAWHKTFDSEAIKAGWERSRFDPCLYFLRCNVSNRLCGVMGVHVDDTAVGGAGEKFNKAIEVLRARFPYRKWRVGEGEFCGAFYTQCSTTKEITMSQKLFAEKLRPANIPRSAKSDDPLTPGQISVLRAINGSLNWLASQSRPDLSVQTSLSQQAFPQPKIQHLREANQAVRRAKQHKDLQIKFSSIPVSELCVCCHSDAAFASVGTHTQAGYIVGFSQTKLHHGEVAHWTPIVWRSYKMPRAVSSTLSGESQAMSTATGTVEWLSLMLSEALDGKFDVRECRSLLSKRPPIIATDCKSLYDHLVSPSSPTGVDDRRTSIDIVIIRESIKLTGAQVRWLPTDRMIADGLTKDKADPIDLLRSCVRAGCYQISPEEFVLAQQAEERALRAQKRQSQSNAVTETSEA
eukprot:s655_g8.t1